MRLRDLLAGVSGAAVDGGDLEREIHRIVCDSREAAPDTLFVALRGGQEVDRHEFIGDALRRGVAAVVVEDDVRCGPQTTRIRVDDCRTLLPALASRLHGEPARQLRCVGVTGTNGKTTTTWLLHRILLSAGQRSAYLGTLGFAAGDTEMETIANTTPEAHHLQSLLARARDQDCVAVAMEVSSHALALHRTDGIPFDTAVFTNLTRDHLDFHRTPEAYLASKGRLFAGLPCSATAVLNRDDPAWVPLASRTRARISTYAIDDPHADVRPLRIDAGPTRTTLHLRSPAGQIEVDSSLTGRFNWANLVAAFAAGWALGIDIEAIREGIASAPRVPGRFEAVDEGQGFGVIVDYAHTPASLQTVLQAARELTHQRLICVFGCGGDRDAGKRPLMGKVAEELADLVFLTSDNPRSEPPRQILDEILRGMDRAERVRCGIDRRLVIEAALAEARCGDLVLIAGKGDEPYQLLADGAIDSDDRLIVRRFLRQLG